MKILALEFSSPQRSVAIVRRDEFHVSPSSPNQSATRTTRPSEIQASQIIESNAAPLSMIEEALREAKLEREQIECIAVGLGPGSYTGIRAAISIVQGWQLARGVKLLGISSAECIAAQAQAEGLTGRAHVIVDAQRGEFYSAGYDLKADGHREIEPLKIITMSDLRHLAGTGDALVGPEISRWLPSGKTIFPRAATLGTLALNRTDFIAGEKLEPIYLRETQFVKAPPPRIIS